LEWNRNLRGFDEDVIPQSIALINSLIAINTAVSVLLLFQNQPIH
jgi:hypothetical protein